MTANQLIKMFNENYGMSPWPKTYKVDYHTYAHCCQYVFDHFVDDIKLYFELDEIRDDVSGEFKVLGISVGPNNGLMFKNVELILKG